ncbi:COMM domain-containing protein 6 [Bombina bombina]|uniref:COMM domain-containing protein 6 n=1 Tax=Bombina bombina TaxID=8345 RepID=UPI00235AB1B4|nr:COMM domain-containing protein 6 [Bombina bombina]
MAAKSEEKMLEREFSALGFEKHGDVIKTLPPDLFAELCQQSIRHLQHQSCGIDHTLLCERLQATGVKTNVEQVEKIVHVITSLFRTAAKHKLSSEDLLSTISANVKVPKQILQVIWHVWKEEGNRLSELKGARDLVPVGQLVDIQWKVGMAVSSDSCRSLNHPYVTLALKVVDYTGKITSKVFELTIPEFQNFFKQFKEMSSVLETV